MPSQSRNKKNLFLSAKGTNQIRLNCFRRSILLLDLSYLENQIQKFAGKCFHLINLLRKSHFLLPNILFYYLLLRSNLTILNKILPILLH